MTCRNCSNGKLAANRLTNDLLAEQASAQRPHQERVAGLGQPQGTRTAQYARVLRASYALTEGGPGGDMRSLDTRARETGAGWAITGEKAFINAAAAGSRDGPAGPV
jgi:hypothetical protein